MSATVALEISDYIPATFNFEGYGFNFRTDGYDETITVCKDIKYIMRFYKYNDKLRLLLFNCRIFFTKRSNIKPS